MIKMLTLYTLANAFNGYKYYLIQSISKVNHDIIILDT